jgi:hypothetical protein
MRSGIVFAYDVTVLRSLMCDVNQAFVVRARSSPDRRSSTTNRRNLPRAPEVDGP